MRYRFPAAEGVTYRVLHVTPKGKGAKVQQAMEVYWPSGSGGEPMKVARRVAKGQVVQGQAGQPW